MTKSPWIDADAYLFDIDGTLLNARGGAHYDAFHAALREGFGITATIDGVPLHGNTDIGILRAVTRREGIADTELDARLDSMLDKMCAAVERDRHRVEALVCGGIPELVGALHADGKLLGIVSGNLERIGWIKVEAAGLRDYFAFGAFSDRTERRADIFRAAIEEVRRRLGAAVKACVIGDTPADIVAAKENGVAIIAVATGIYSIAELKAHHPDLCAASCDELVPLLRAS